MADPTTQTGASTPSTEIARKGSEPVAKNKLRVATDVICACLTIWTALYNGRDRTVIYRLASDAGLTQEDVDTLLSYRPLEDLPAIDHLGRVVPDWKTAEVPK